MNNSTIYSDNFKAWFGDWEKDPKNSSKVVDSEGRPLPVYHGTVRKTKDGLPFKVFKCESEMGEGVMFSDKYSVASFFSGGGEARFGNFTDKFDKWENKNTIDGLVDFLNTVLKNGKYEISHNEGDYNGKHYEIYHLNHEYPGGSTSSPLGNSKEKAYEKLLKQVEKEIYYLERDSKHGYNGGIYNVYLNIRNPYIFDAKGNNFFNLSTDFDQQNRINVFTLVSYVKKTGQYDGVIVKNVRETTLGNGILSTDFIVFKPNQIKHALDNNGNYDNNMDDMTENFVRECIREALVEMIDEVRYIDTKYEKYNGKVQKNHWTDEYNGQEPIKNGEKIRVFHGCELQTACQIAIEGTSGKTYHPRQYSYESGMNPLGIFVTTDFEVAKKFGVSNTGMCIIEFTADTNDLEAPVWNGQGTYFGQGTNPIPFKNSEERNSQKMQYRKDAQNLEDDDYYVNGKKHNLSMSHIRNSDKPELANSIFRNNEHQALFMGDLNPNMIKRIWVNLPGDNGYVHTSNAYRPMSVKAFLKEFGNKEWVDYDYGRNRKYKIKKTRLFDPAENVRSFDDLIDRLYQKDRNYFKTRDEAAQCLKDQGMLQNPPTDYAFDIIKYELWPRQIIQLYGKEYFDKNFNRLGQ